jgi:mannan endo-1,4-beta-mannosidase
VVERDVVDGHYHCGPLNISDPGDPQRRTDDVDAGEVRERMVRTAMDRHWAGHIITLMWHCPFPSYGDRGDYSTLWTYDDRPGPDTWDELTTPGTALQAQWAAQADRIAGYLKQFRDADIPVLWRPYHEMNGVWFWWCNHKGERGFKRLWIMMHDYFANHHRLDNLIWVWNANAPRDRPGDEAYDYHDFYPGGEYVDILAADVYRNDYRQSHHDDLAELGQGRPIALGEVGELPAPGILDSQPAWTWFMSWGKTLTYCNAGKDIARLYRDPRVLTTHELNRSNDGIWSIDTERPGTQLSRE